MSRSNVRQRGWFAQLAFLLLIFIHSSLHSLASDRNTAPPFSVRKESSGWWLINPAGERFFSLGVCVIHQGAARDRFDIENPGYAAWQHYQTPSAWADATLRRLKSWNFTTLGGWSDFSTLRESPEQTLWLTPVLHIGSTAGAPWWDMWDNANVRRMESVAREQILKFRNDPRLLGYYSDNELGWWNATLWKMTLEQPATSGQRKQLIRLLREIYHSDWKQLERDFEAEGAANWRQLNQGGMLFLKSGGKGIQTMRRFLELLADRYYQLMREIIRKYDSRGLFLGDRYQSFYYPEVARAAGRHVDVVSSNLNASWNDGTFLRSYLDTLHALTSKPILISEFYLAASENRSGNRNTEGIYPVVSTQAERARAARTTLEALLKLPYVLGADWFQFADEPRHGRDDGENFNFGLVDIFDQPYRETIDTFQTFKAETLKAGSSPRRLDASSGIPPAPSEPFAEFVPTRALKQWDRERGFVKPVTEFPMGDLYLCWNTNALYLGLYTVDIVEAAYYRGAGVPKQDRALWTVGLGGREIVRARIGAGREPLFNEPSVRIENISGLNLNVRNIAAMELPARFVGRNRLEAGDVIELNSVLTSHCGAYRVIWKGTFTLSE